jgi:hypothetical protein
LGEWAILETGFLNGYTPHLLYPLNVLGIHHG